MLFESQSRPSYNPSPEVAHVLWIYLQNIKGMYMFVSLGEFLFMWLNEGQRRGYLSTYQWRCRREWRPSLSVISAAFIALGRSCLFANTSNTASLNSSCPYRRDLAIINRTSFQITCPWPIIWWVMRLIKGKREKSIQG